MESDNYQLAIIGTGPAGMTASIYASRYKINNVVVGEAPGGLIFEAHKICNYPGNNEIRGSELTMKMQEHVRALGGEILSDRVSEINKQDDGFFEIKTEGGKSLKVRALLIATGTEHRKLGLPNEDTLTGRGISYCATCDAMFYRDKVVGVVGGSDASNTASLCLSEAAKKVYQIYRRDALRGDLAWIDQVMKRDNIEVIFNANVSELVGEEKLEGVVLDKEYKGSKKLDLDGLFVEIGTYPRREILDMLDIKTNEEGYVEVDKTQRTNKEGIWAAGDITNGSNNFRQIITAASEGAIAADDIFNWFQKNKS
jgi:thioredoxin reductase (NADPH)